MGKYVNNLVKEAKKAKILMQRLSSSQKNEALRAMADLILKEKKYIIGENKLDVEKAKKAGLKKSFIDRLAVGEKTIKEMSLSLKAVAKLPDPVGKVISSTVRPNKMRLEKIRVPLGVVLVVYEARPNVTSDCAGLLFKSSNVAVLRGGSRAMATNFAVGKVLQKALKKVNINFKPFFVVDKPGHEITQELFKQSGSIDLVIPRGGESLIRKVTELSQIPVIKHYKGVCHIYLDEKANLKKAIKICLNAKVQRFSVCNAVETILVHKKIAKKILPLLEEKFTKEKVKIKACRESLKVLKNAQAAKESDWQKEYLDLIVAVKTVSNLSQAIEHINCYGSGHTDSIITENNFSAGVFLKEVDSACCFHNLSTRFSDGYQFGLGAEIGISTDKLHARGPMGLEELTTYKWVGKGSGQIRS